MKVNILNEFFIKLNSQVNYIAQDKPSAARKFKSDVFEFIRGLESTSLYTNRKSVYYDDENIRDLIFKGYKIIYRIKPKEDIIEVFAFINYQEKP